MAARRPYPSGPTPNTNYPNPTSRFPKQLRTIHFLQRAPQAAPPTKTETLPFTSPPTLFPKRTGPKKKTYFFHVVLVRGGESQQAVHPVGPVCDFGAIARGEWSRRHVRESLTEISWRGIGFARDWMSLGAHEACLPGWLAGVSGSAVPFS